MINDERVIVDLSPTFVYFVPLDDGKVAIMLPVLPQLVVFNDPGYKSFVHAFDSVIIEYEEHHENNDLIGVVYVYHQAIIYKFNALMPFLDACLSAENAVVVPYCPEEGFPEQDIYGGDVPVVKRTAIKNEYA